MAIDTLEPIVIDETSFPNLEAEDFYRDLIWGTPGKVRFRYARGVDPAYFKRDDHALFIARRQGTLVGAYVVGKRPWGYFRYLLGVRDDAIGTGVGHRLVRHVYDTYIDRLQPGQHILGTIEGTNTRSLDLSLKYYDLQRNLDVLTFTRRFPRRSKKCLEGFTSAFPNPQNMVFPRIHAYTIRSGSRQAGVLIQHHAWSLESLGQPLLDRIALPALPILLGVRSEMYQFGMFHDFWGSPELHNELWEHCLADQGLTSGIAVGDSLDSHWTDIKERCRKGLLGQLVGNNQLLVTGTGAPNPFLYPPLNSS